MIVDSGNTVEFINMNNFFDGLFVGSWSKAMYYPILLSSICNESKVLFLDSDIIVAQDLGQFYNTDLSGYYCAAVRDYGMQGWINEKHSINLSNNEGKKMTIDKYFSDVRKWGKDDMARYFNSGVLLLNLDEIRKCDAEKKMLEILKTEKLACPDQDCFNICFHEKVKIMPEKYNFMVLVPAIYDNLPDDERLKYDFFIANNRPNIIHFLWKPWISNSNKIPFADEFYKYRNMTVWKYCSTRKKILRLKLSAKQGYCYIFGKKVFEYCHEV